MFVYVVVHTLFFFALLCTIYSIRGFCLAIKEIIQGE